MIRRELWYEKSRHFLFIYPAFLLSLRLVSAWPKLPDMKIWLRILSVLEESVEAGARGSSSIGRPRWRTARMPNSCHMAVIW